MYLTPTSLPPPLVRITEIVSLKILSIEDYLDRGRIRVLRKPLGHCYVAASYELGRIIRIAAKPQMIFI